MKDRGSSRIPYADVNSGRSAIYPRIGGNAEDGVFGATGARLLSGVTTLQLGCMIITTGFLVRLIAAMLLSPHVDEPSSLLAARSVAENGLPVLPSGTVYFQGAPLSYLLQPFFWLGLGDLQNLGVLRLVSVVAGTAALYLGYRLAVTVTGDSRIGLLVAALIAIDPLSVQWSGHLRMYSLLQTFTLGLVWAFILLLTRGSSPVRISLVVGLFWLAVFTHVGAVLLGPAMAVAVLLVFRRKLLRQWAVLGCIALCALAPVTLMGLNQRLGTSSVSQSGEEPSTVLLTFVGDNLLTPLARFNSSMLTWDWGTVIQTSNLYWLVPGIIVAIATLIAGRILLIDERTINDRRVAVIVLLSFYWLPMVAVGVFTVSPKERYLLNVHVLGYVFVALLIGVLVSSPSSRARNWTSQLGGIGMSLAIVLAISAGLVWRLDNPVVHPDYNVAMSYVADHHKSGEPVVVALPAVADLVMNETDRDDMRFLAGAQDRPRAQRYTRIVDDNLVDYWVGVDSIVEAQQLQMLLLNNPDAWIVVDQGRLSAEWAYAGEIRQVLRDLTYPVMRTPGGGLVLRALSADEASGSGQLGAQSETDAFNAAGASSSSRAQPSVSP